MPRSATAVQRSGRDGSTSCSAPRMPCTCWDPRCRSGCRRRCQRFRRQHPQQLPCALFGRTDAHLGGARADQALETRVYAARVTCGVWAELLSARPQQLRTGLPAPRIHSVAVVVVCWRAHRLDGSSHLWVFGDRLSQRRARHLDRRDWLVLQPEIGLEGDRVARVGAVDVAAPPRCRERVVPCLDRLRFGDACHQLGHVAVEDEGARVAPLWRQRIENGGTDPAAVEPADGVDADAQYLVLPRLQQKVEELDLQLVLHFRGGQPTVLLQHLGAHPLAMTLDQRLVARRGEQARAQLAQLLLERQHQCALVRGVWRQPGITQQLRVARAVGQRVGPALDVCGLQTVVRRDRLQPHWAMAVEVADTLVLAGWQSGLGALDLGQHHVRVDAVQVTEVLARELCAKVVRHALQRRGAQLAVAPVFPLTPCMCAARLVAARFVLVAHLERAPAVGVGRSSAASVAPGLHRARAARDVRSAPRAPPWPPFAQTRLGASRQGTPGSCRRRTARTSRCGRTALRAAVVVGYPPHWQRGAAPRRPSRRQTELHAAALRAGAPPQCGAAPPAADATRTRRLGRARSAAGATRAPSPPNQARAPPSSS
eukprot:5356104-Prymnesium_polylepis.3